MRTLTLHSPCGLIRGMIDHKVLPNQIAYPLVIECDQTRIHIYDGTGTLVDEDLTSRKGYQI